MQRRDFLKLCGTAGLGLVAPVGPSALRPGSGQAWAAQGEPAPYEGPYYAFVYADGGWDTTSIMDPKGVNGINRLYQEGDIQTEGAHRYAPTAKHISGGISNEAFFKKYGRELLVVNGLDYSDNSHVIPRRYLATGKIDSLSYPSFLALVAACRSKEQPLTFLTFGGYSGTGGLVPMARIPSLQPLNLIANADAAGGNDRDAFVTERIERTLAERAEANGSAARLPRTEHAQGMLYAAQFNSKTLQRVTAYVPKTTPKGQIPQQADIALASFKAGVCVAANLTSGFAFDSHAKNDEEQMRLIPEFLSGVDYLLRRAEELGIREKLVVVVHSEMGRTPKYNQGNGKDHWSIGSIMFLGRGIRGNRVLGATDEKQLPVTVDPKTLGIDKEKGIRIRPEHLHVALRELAGIDAHALTRQFPLNVPEGERLHGLWG